MSSSSVSSFPLESWAGRFGKVHVGAAGNTVRPEAIYVQLIGNRQTVAAATGAMPGRLSSQRCLPQAGSWF